MSDLSPQSAPKRTTTPENGIGAEAGVQAVVRSGVRSL